jgi:hypothetical protein
MVIASLLHFKAFDYKLFEPENNNSESNPLLTFREAFWDSFFWLDLWQDLIVVSSFFFQRAKKMCQCGARWISSPASLERLDSSSIDFEQESPLISSAPNLLPLRLNSNGSLVFNADNLHVSQELSSLKDDTDN